MASIRFVITVVSLVSLIAVGGCGILPVPVDLDSGITGIVQAGPTCPVVRPDMDCADKPIVATIIVRDAALGLEITRFTSGADGAFRVPLFAGQYLLDPQSVSGYIGTAARQNVDVQAGRLTNVMIEYDTGIR